LLCFLLVGLRHSDECEHQHASQNEPPTHSRILPRSLPYNHILIFHRTERPTRQNVGGFCNVSNDRGRGLGPVGKSVEHTRLIFPTTLERTDSLSKGMRLSSNNDVPY
jgi:hypothetical protein